MNYKIGNLVQFKSDPDRCTTLTESCFEGSYIEKTYNPIPIDDTWFLNFGFVEWSVKQSGYSGLVYAKQYGENMYCVQKDAFKFVHELQNYWFENTGVQLQLLIKNTHRCSD